MSIMEGRYLLYRAIESSDFEVVKSFLAKDDFDNKDPKLLEIAIEKGNLDIIETLLQNGVSARAEPEIDKSPLFHAVKCSNLEVMNLLLTYGASIQNEPCLLPVAVNRSSFETVEFLLKHGADVYAKFLPGKTPLFYAVERANLEVLKLLLTNKAATEDDTEPLYTAVEESSLEVIEVLLKYGANPNAEYQGDIEENMRRRTKGVNTLFDDEDDTLSDDENVLKDATQLITHVSMLKISFEKLLSEPKEFSKSSRVKGRTLLHRAAEIGREEVVRLLLEYGADFDRRTLKGLTPLIIAADRGHLKVIQILLEFDAAVDHTDIFRRTAFHAAAKNGHVAILKVLLDYSFNDPKLLIKTRIFEIEELRREFISHHAKSESWNKFLNTVCTHYIKAAFIGSKNIRYCPKDFIAVEKFLKDKLEKMKPFFYFCKMEAKKIKSEMIGNSAVAFCDFLTNDENQLAKFARNKEVIQTLKSDDFKETFKIYGSIISNQFHKGELRNQLIEQGVKHSHFLFTNVSLPQIVVEEILNNLDNKDVRAFINACALQRTEFQCDDDIVK